MSDKLFLKWIHDRLVNIYGANKDSDYMHKLRAIIYHIPKDQISKNKLTFEQNKEVLFLQE